jgi:hypothetical protein
LAIARELVQGATEAHWRSAAGRTYYALLLEARDALQRWGFAVPARNQVHFFVRGCFTGTTDPDLKEIGYALERLSNLRNKADYQLFPSRVFATSSQAKQAIKEAEINLARLDAVEVDGQRRAAAIAAIRAGIP